MPEPHTWEVIAISRKQWELVAAAASLGGNVRVGLEDNFYLPSGEMAKSNGDLVENAARLVELSGRTVAIAIRGACRSRPAGSPRPFRLDE